MTLKAYGSIKKTDLVPITSVALTTDVSGVLPVANGGTGTGTYTDGQILIGQTAGNTLAKFVMSGAATMTAGGVVSLAAGGFANPTATVGLAAVNGSATTAMRSDAAPALDVSIVPTWSGQHTFSVNPIVSNAAPGLILTDTTASAKSLTLKVDANQADLRESAGATSSLLVLDLVNNNVGIGGVPAVNQKLYVNGKIQAAFDIVSDGTLFGVVIDGKRLYLTGAGSDVAWGTAGLQVRAAAQIFTDTSALGTRATGTSWGIGRPTFAATNVVTITDSATLYVENAPLAGTNMTLTNPYAVWIDDGAVRLDGAISLGSALPGTVGQPLLSGGAGVVCTWGQDIRTTATPQFAGLGIGGAGVTDQLKFANNATIIGSSASAGTLTVNSTSHATKGFVYFGSSAGLNYDETNVRLGLGGVPSHRFHMVGGVALLNNNASGDANSGLRIVSAVATTHYNWMWGTQQNVGAAIEFTPSTVVDGSSFTTPIVVITQAGNLCLGTNTVGTGGVFNFVLGGGATSPVLAAATPDKVHFAGIDNGAGNREFQIQAELGGLFAFGNNIFRGEGAAAKTFQVSRHPTADTAGNALTVQSGGSTAAATNKAAGDMIVATGLGTGTGLPARVRVQSPAQGTAAGTGDQALVDRVIVNGTAALTTAVASTIVTCTIGSGSQAGGHVVYSIEASDAGGDRIEASGQVAFSAINKGGVYTTATSVLGAEAVAKTNGTHGIVNTWAFAAGGGALQLTSTLTVMTATTYRITYTVISNSQQAVSAP